MDNEIIRYGISGVIIAAINFLIYTGLQLLGMAYFVANIFGIIISKLCGFVLNKFFVYRSKNTSVKENIKEAAGFAVARGFTGLVDYFGVLFLVEILSVGKWISKLLAMVIVIFLNYILGKIVFRNVGSNQN